MHALGVAHRDIKPDNVIFSNRSKSLVRVVDFGFAKIINDRTFTFLGTPDYMPLEIIKCHSYSLPCDWWGLGVLLYEMLYGSPPFSAKTQSQIFRNVIKQ